MKLRITQYASRLKNHADTLIGLLLFAVGLYAYTGTLAPTVLQGDAALFQYTPAVLGVTYPTGYPLYILLGKLWVTLLPLGEIAWRMNLLSALLSSLALPLIYGAARHLFSPVPSRPINQQTNQHPSPHSQFTIDNSQSPIRAAALAAVLIFATLPTFWRWSTEAKIYALNILLFSGVLYTLAHALHAPSTTPTQTNLHPSSFIHNSPFTIHHSYPLVLPVLLFGLQLAVHSTTVLLIPGLLLFVWLNLRPYLFTPRRFLAHTLLLILPGLLYFYVPLRAEWLIAHLGRDEAIGMGLLADFYRSGLPGLMRYFTAADFTGGVITNWGEVPQQFFTVYLPLLVEDFTLPGVALGVIGGLSYAFAAPRRFFPLLLLYAAPIPFVLTYGQGEQSAFLLPSFLIFALFGGYTLLAATNAIAYVLRFTFSKDAGREGKPPGLQRRMHVFAPLLLLLLFTFQLFPQIRHNTLWLNTKWTRDIYNEWADALNHPLDAGAGMLAHWGDLTSFWYMQHAEQRRPDLRGVYPPDEDIVLNWFERGNDNLFIAGPLQGWATGIEQRYQLIPWGRLVRIAPRERVPESLLPPLPQPIDAVFSGQLRLIAADFAPQAVAGQDFPVTLTWQALAELNADTSISLRLVRDDGIVAQLDEPLRSGWFPRETLPVGQYLLGYPLLHVPLGTLPGAYRLQLVSYTNDKQPWLLPSGEATLTLGDVEITPPPSGTLPDPDTYKFPPPHDFNGEIRLAGFDYSVNRVGQGKGFATRLLWQAITPPADNYTLHAELLDAAGSPLRSWAVLPQDGRAPTSAWQPGQYIRDQIDLVVPASAPPGDEALQVRLSWLRPDGSRLNLRRRRIPLDDGLNLPPLQVTEKEARQFELPPLEQRLEANFAGKALLTGYNTRAPLQVNQAECAAGTVDACRVALEMFWQGVTEMEHPYNIFIHVVNAQGQIIAQSDHAPGRRGKQPTTGWLPGEVVLDPVDLPLPPDIAPGRYTLRAGLYLPTDGTRLQRLDSSGQPASDFVEVGAIEVR